MAATPDAFSRRGSNETDDLEDAGTTHVMRGFANMTMRRDSDARNSDGSASTPSQPPSKKSPPVPAIPASPPAKETPRRMSRETDEPLQGRSEPAAARNIPMGGPMGGQLVGFPAPAEDDEETADINESVIGSAGEPQVDSRRSSTSRGREGTSSRRYSRLLDEIAPPSAAPLTGSDLTKARHQNSQVLGAVRKDMIEVAPQDILDIPADRGLISINRELRPIRLDTRETMGESLNVVVGELQMTKLLAHNKEVSRSEKMRSLTKEIQALQYKRATHSLMVDSWKSDTWRWVNANKSRRNQKELLQDVPQSARKSKMRDLERSCLAAASQGVKPPSAQKPRTKMACWS